MKCFGHAKIIGCGIYNGDLQLMIFDNDLKNLDEKLIGKSYIYTSITANFASVFLSDQSFYIITALDKNNRVTRPIVMKYDLQNQTFEFQKIADEGTRPARRRISPPSTLWFKKGYFLVFWDQDDTFRVRVRKTDLQLFSYYSI